MPEARAPSGPYHKACFAYDPERDVFICPQGQPLHVSSVIRRENGEQGWRYRATGAVCRACPAFGICTTDARQGRGIVIGPQEGLLVQHRALMATDEATRIYALRKELVEPVFGIQKEQQGARRFLLRARVAVEAEWRLLGATFNLRVVARLWQHRPALVALGSAG